MNRQLIEFKESLIVNNHQSNYLTLASYLALQL